MGIKYDYGTSWHNLICCFVFVLVGGGGLQNDSRLHSWDEISVHILLQFGSHVCSTHFFEAPAIQNQEVT